MIPGFQDNTSTKLFLHPTNCLAQFLTTVPVATQESVISGLGLTIVERHRTPGLYTLEVPQATTDPSALTLAINGLNARPEVKFAEPNFLGFDDLESPMPPAAPAVGSTNAGSDLAWNLGLVRVPDVWDYGRGSPDVILAVIDTGVELDNPSLAGGILPRAADDDWNFTDDGSPVPADDEGHGTFIAGLLVGNGARGVQGICLGCRLLPLKIPLQGEPNTYARRRDAILYALDRVPAGGRLVMNISWKTTGDVGLIRDALAIAAAQGAIIAASAGNFPDRPNEPHYPSDYPSVISVAAVGPTKRRASYSYFGDAVGLSAPGGDSAVPSGSLTSVALGGATTQDSGTSFAAPHVVGIAALLLSDVPVLTAAQVRSILESTASPLADPGMGKGLVDAAAALQLALSTGGASPPTPTPLPSTGSDGLRGEHRERQRAGGPLWSPPLHGRPAGRPPPVSAVGRPPRHARPDRPAIRCHRGGRITCIGQPRGPPHRRRERRRAPRGEHRERQRAGGPLWSPPLHGRPAGRPPPVSAVGRPPQHARPDRPAIRCHRGLRLTYLMGEPRSGFRFGAVLARFTLGLRPRWRKNPLSSNTV